MKTTQSPACASSNEGAPGSATLQRGIENRWATIVSSPTVPYRGSVPGKNESRRDARRDQLRATSREAVALPAPGCAPGSNNGGGTYDRLGGGIAPAGSPPEADFRAFALSFLLLFAPAGATLAQTVNVLTTVPDLADVARRIGGDLVIVTSLTEGSEDIHLVPIRPSMFAKARAADVFLEVGLDLEHAWVPALLQNARNAKIRPGSAGFVNCSAGIKPHNIPTDLSRGQGTDLHPRGNPHVNLDPEGMRQIARNVRDGLTAAHPAGKDAFNRGLAAFEAELDRRIAAWTERLAPFRGAAFIEHHDAWVYFAERFGLRIVARLEPKPGLAPTPAHLASVIETARAEKVGLVLGKAGGSGGAEKVASESGAQAVVLPLSSTASDASWFAFMDRVVDTFATHLRR